MTGRGFSMNERAQVNSYAIEPKVYVDATPKFGFTEYAEKLNGRLAMIGFVSLIAIEVLTGHGFIAWLSNT
ncbi:MAG: high light inducible protein [Calothrix sp. C42_A2020_038]|nr:high light inducible protein [Calothrix sp. C42_A2020_038]